MGVFTCSCCQKSKTAKDFYGGVTAQQGEYMPICRECCSTKLDKYESILGEDGAFWSLCGELGIPFIKEFYNSAVSSARSARKTTTPKSKLDYYLNKLKHSEIIYTGFWDSDTMITDFVLSGKVVNNIALSNSEMMKQRWGNYPDIEAYQFLEETYENYTKDLIDMDANLTNRYRDLCKAEYRKRKADESGDVQEIARAQENLIKLLNLLKLNEFNRETDERLKFIDRLAWMIEETEPAEEEDEQKYKDIAGYEESFNELMRSMQNMIAGTRNYPQVPRSEE